MDISKELQFAYESGVNDMVALIMPPLEALQSDLNNSKLSDKTFRTLAGYIVNDTLESCNDVLTRQTN